MRNETIKQIPQTRAQNTPPQDPRVWPGLSFKKCVRIDIGHWWHELDSEFSLMVHCTRGRAATVIGFCMHMTPYDAACPTVGQSDSLTAFFACGVSFFVCIKSSLVANHPVPAQF